MKIVAVVPARSGSRRLRNKNVLPFGGSNLLVHKIRQLKLVNGLDGIVVSSDSEEYLDMARSEGVETHKREPEFADDIKSPIGDVVRNICESIDCDDVLWAHCTSPLVSPSQYESAIAEYRSAIASGYDSLMSFEQIREFLWNENGPINYESGKGQPRSQDLPPLYRYNSGIVIAPRLKMIEWGSYHGPKPYMFIMDKMSSVDIDDGLDMACARAYLEMGRE